MDSEFGQKVRQVAKEVSDRIGEGVQTAGERIGELREKERIGSEIRTLNREKDRCRQVMADLLIRMFDQNVFAEALLRPEYERIKEIDVQVAQLEVERTAVGHVKEATPSAEPTPAAADTDVQAEE
ncbi:MAG: hypothetical protein ACYDBB_09300 [Armatimonadota bacterium]